MLYQKLLSALLCICILLSTVCFVSAAETGKDIIVLYTNDVHCGVSDNIGYAGLSAYRNMLEEEGHTVILVDAGDAIQGAPIGTLSKGAYLTDIQNQMGYDVLVPGNHEFDYGMDQFLKLAETSGDYVCCNFLDADGQSVFPPYRLITAGDTTIAFLGITTPETLSSSTPVYFQDADGNYIYSFCEDDSGQALYQAVQRAVDAASQQADYVVAVGHLGMAGSPEIWRSDTVIANTTGIDVFLDAHAHETIPSMTVKNKENEDVILSSTGTKLLNIGKLTISGDGTMTTELIQDYPHKDSAMVDYIGQIEARFSDDLNQIIAQSQVDLIANAEDGSRIIRTKETNAGNFCADAYRAVSGADIAFVNAGGIRANIRKGSVTYGDIIQIHPFSNELCVVEATGQEILDALEMGAKQAPEENGSLQQVSGLSYEIHAYYPSGVVEDEKGNFVKVVGEYRVKNVRIGDEPLELDKIYTLASHNYLLKNAGGGFVMFRDNKLLQDCVMPDNQVLMEYVQKHLNGIIGSAYAASENRIQIFTTPFVDVSKQAWYSGYVSHVFARGIMTGTYDKHFDPDGVMNRAMLVTTLYRLSGSPAVAGSVSSVFSDCTDGMWFSDAILWAYQNGIVDGYGKGIFAPHADLTREAMAKILYQYDLHRGAQPLMSASLEYQDALSISQWALPGVCYCTQNGWLQGSDSMFRPQVFATRAMAAKVLAVMDQPS